MIKYLEAVITAAAVSVMAGLLSAAGPAGASVGAGSAATAGQARTGVVWGRCSDPLLVKAHAQCGYVSVPLSYSDPHGQQIKIAVSRIRHTSSSRDYQGVIVTNPGGPGGSGLNLNTYLISALKSEGYGAAAADYDWIGFDPRGVGSSKPAVSCIPDYLRPDRPSYIPHTPQLLRYWLHQSQRYAQACGGVSPVQSALLRNMTTQDVATDMDRIRQALGQQQITYYGFSYGTYLGQVYATLFPSHVRRLIMDSNVDPLRGWYQDVNLVQDGPYNRNEDIWFGWIAKYDGVYHLGSTEGAVRNLFYATEAKLAAHPAGGKIGPDEWTDIFVEATYSEQTWPYLAQAFAGWIHQHNAAAARLLIEWYKAIDAPGYDNGFAVYLSVVCTGSHWPLNWNIWNKDVSAIYQKAPFAAWWNAWFNAPCIFWPAPSTQPVKVNGTRIRSALLIDQTLDAATPFQGSLVVRRLFPHSVLIAEPGGTSHADSLAGDKCVDGTIAGYLETGVLPLRKLHARWDKTCAPLPPPVPSAAHGSPTPAARPPSASRTHGASACPPRSSARPRRPAETMPGLQNAKRPTRNEKEPCTAWSLKVATPPPRSPRGLPGLGGRPGPAPSPWFVPRR
jgi:pimeloyl-ACP methyl ester carboxylesterase